jgi:hypothetical protein
VKLALLGKVGLVAATAGGSAIATAVMVDAADPVVPPIGAQAWIDAPLDGTHYETGPVEVVAHATDVDGIASVSLAVDGDKVATKTLSGFDDLVTVELSWTAASDGEHELTVTGKDSNGNTGQPGTATISVGEADETGGGDEVAAGGGTTTTVAGATTTLDADPTTTVEGGSTATSLGQPSTTAPGSTTTTRAPGTTTTVPCPGTPVPASPANGATVSLAPTLRWSYTGCVVPGFFVQVSRSPGFERIDQDGLVDWPDRELALSLFCPDDGDTYYWRVRATGSRTGGPWSAARSFTLLCRA